MSSKALKKEIDKALSNLTTEQLREVWRFIIQLNKSPKTRSKFWELAGAGNSGLSDVGSRKHKYLAEAYEKDS